MGSKGNRQQALNQAESGTLQISSRAVRGWVAAVMKRQGGTALRVGPLLLLTARLREKRMVAPPQLHLASPQQARQLRRAALYLEALGVLEKAALRLEALGALEKAALRLEALGVLEKAALRLEALGEAAMGPRMEAMQHHQAAPLRARAAGQGGAAVGMAALARGARMRGHLQVAAVARALSGRLKGAAWARAAEVAAAAQT